MYDCTFFYTKKRYCRNNSWCTNKKRKKINNYETDAILMSLEETHFVSIMLKSLLIFHTNQIINNSGFEEKEIIEEIINSKFNKIFNAQSENFELIRDTKVLVSKEVVTNTFINSILIAGMILTTTSLVNNENKKISKNSDYNDL